MSDNKEVLPIGSVVHYPDGSIYVYLQAAQNLETGTYVEPNVNGKITKFAGGLKFPKGICLERVKAGEHTLVMTKAADIKAPPAIVKP